MIAFPRISKGSAHQSRKSRGLHREEHDCVQMCERAGFRGIYLVEQWSRREQDLDAEKIAEWLLARVRANI